MEIPPVPLDEQPDLDPSAVTSAAPAAGQGTREPIYEPVNDWELRALDVTAGEPD